MAIKVGNIISHSGGFGWGAGKVLEVTANSALIQFSDGTNRRIASSHFSTLEAAAPDLFNPPPQDQTTIKPPKALRAVKKKKPA